ncbi:ABC transporter ATP-binding protein [Alkaliphilus serpentinus]|uniref:ABC transporter ATP-binding protein n=1 Tax=Alkaliphilus serpentinus TaxID=1482731 RepID=A0A833HQB1_9FIRM|nr:ABC transporter ATP-binding protein [Alkaliphilus serpentinus]KAB3531567.1 ABC transporter ATP-binding protein [Alkaliphilus serpentinus]
MRELLLKRKSRFILYVFACLFPVIDQVLKNYSFALLIGSIEVATIDYFIKVLMINIAITLLGILLFMASRFMRISYMRDTILDVRLNAFDKILKKSYEGFSKKSKDVYISNLVNDVNIFEREFFFKLINVIFRGGAYIASIGLLMFMDFRFAMVMLIISLSVFFLSKRFEKRTVKLQEEVSDNNESFTVGISNTLNGLEILKLNRLEDEFLYKSLKKVDDVERKKFHFTVFTEGQRSLTRFLGYVIFVGILMYLLNLAFAGESITRITFMLQLANSCVWTIGMVLPLFNDLKAAAKIYNKITKSDGEATTSINKKQSFSFNKFIEVKDLRFSYEGKEILKGASFTIEKGKKYLLKGPSGAGKSTLIKLLSMIYDNYEGSIKVDGVDFREIKEDTINDHVSYIYQDVFLFEDTVKNNITLFKDMPEKRILKATKHAGLDEFLATKELGLNEPLMENGKNLSGGQRQRISIARAIIKDASLLFVDEGTSSLNQELGSAIEDTILSLDSTVIAISHRYYEGITEKYDYVLELNNGQILQHQSQDYLREVAV